MLRNTFLEMIPQFRSMNNPMFHRTISDAIIDFIKVSDSTHYFVVSLLSRLRMKGLTLESSVIHWNLSYGAHIDVPKDSKYYRSCLTGFRAR